MALTTEPGITKEHVHAVGNLITYLQDLMGTGENKLHSGLQAYTREALLPVLQK